MNEKAEQFQKSLQERNIDCFIMEEGQGEFHPVFFSSRLEVEGQFLPLILLLDDSIYSLIRVQVTGKVLKEERRAALLEYINNLNGQFKVFKYYFTEEGILQMDACVPTTSETFDSNMLYTLIQVMLEHLQQEYSRIMQTLWKE